MKVKEIKHGNTVLARYIPASVAWSDDLNFFSDDEDFIQFGTWGYNSGKELKAHIHNEVVREVKWTQEVLYVRKGKLKARIYDKEEKLVDNIIVNEGDLIVLLHGGHGYDIIEDGTQVLEVKNGPYVGAEVDRKRF
jgi:hypothetical protein|tara:strand:+ start:297 stop:704 length:408 start_codon:yes stop_codon:yes gene_type:complete